MEGFTYEEIQQTLARFDGVWDRVTGKQTGNVSGGGEGELPALIRDELCAARFDSMLSRMFQGAARSELQDHAASAACRARKLRAEYFILSGELCPGKEKCGAPACRMEGLRSAFLRDSRMAEAYKKAAAGSSVRELTELYTAFQKELTRSAAEKRARITACF